MEKKYKIIILILIGILTLIIIFYPREIKYFNKIDLDTNTLVVNKNKTNYLDTIIKVGLSELNIKPDIILVRNMEGITFNKEEGLEIKAFIRKEKNGFIIYMNNYSRNEYIKILSHELIHLRDMYTNDLYVSDSLVIYKGEIYTNTTIPEYFDRPWEKEAFKNENNLREKIINKLY